MRLGIFASGWQEDLPTCRRAFALRTAKIEAVIYQGLTIAKTRLRDSGSCAQVRLGVTCRRALELLRPATTEGTAAA